MFGSPSFRPAAAPVLHAVPRRRSTPPLPLAPSPAAKPPLPAATLRRASTASFLRVTATTPSRAAATVSPRTLTAASPRAAATAASPRVAARVSTSAVFPSAATAASATAASWSLAPGGTTPVVSVCLLTPIQTEASPASRASLPISSGLRKAFGPRSPPSPPVDPPATREAESLTGGGRVNDTPLPPEPPQPQPQPQPQEPRPSTSPSVSDASEGFLSPSESPVLEYPPAPATGEAGEEEELE